MYAFNCFAGKHETRSAGKGCCHSERSEDSPEAYRNIGKTSPASIAVFSKRFFSASRFRMTTAFSRFAEKSLRFAPFSMTFQRSGESLKSENRNALKSKELGKNAGRTALMIWQKNRDCRTARSTSKRNHLPSRMRRLRLTAQRSPHMVQVSASMGFEDSR